MKTVAEIGVMCLHFKNTKYSWQSTETKIYQSRILHHEKSFKSETEIDFLRQTKIEKICHQ